MVSVRRGLADGVGLLAHMMTLPLLGVLADAFGRRKICILSVVGLMTQCALLALAAVVPNRLALPCIFAGEVRTAVTRAIVPDA